MVKNGEPLALIEFRHDDLVIYTKTFSEETRIGGGKQADVYIGTVTGEMTKAYGMQEGDKIAIKYYQKKDPSDVPDPSEDEREWYKTLGHHKYLIKLLGSCYHNQRFILVMEYADNGVLTRAIQERVLTWSQTLRIIKGLAKFLIYTKEKRIVLNDFKPDNVLLDKNWNPKVCDLGALSFQGQKCKMGTTGYMPLERFGKDYRHPLEDLYALGVVILQLITKTHPVNYPKANVVGTVHLATDLLEQGAKDVVHPSLRNSGCSEESAIRVTQLGYELCGPKAVGRDYHKFLKDEVKKLWRREKLDKLKDKLKEKVKFWAA